MRACVRACVALVPAIALTPQSPPSHPLSPCSYTYTSEDVKQLLEEKKAKGQGRYNPALESAKLARERDAARERGDADVAER